MSGEDPAPSVDPAPRRRHRRAVRAADGAATPQPGDQSSDDTAAGWAEAPASASRDDDWYLRERPPHWG